MKQGIAHVGLMIVLGIILSAFKVPGGGVILIASLATGIYLNAKRK